MRRRGHDYSHSFHSLLLGGNHYEEDKVVCDFTGCCACGHHRRGLGEPGDRGDGLVERILEEAGL
jgi:hypothetical protein